MKEKEWKKNGTHILSLKLFYYKELSLAVYYRTQIILDINLFLSNNYWRWELAKLASRSELSGNAQIYSHVISETVGVEATGPLVCFFNVYFIHPLQMRNEIYKGKKR